MYPIDSGAVLHHQDFEDRERWFILGNTLFDEVFIAEGFFAPASSSRRYSGSITRTGLPPSASWFDRQHALSGSLGGLSVVLMLHRTCEQRRGVHAQTLDLRPAIFLPIAQPHERAKGRREFIPARLVRGDHGTRLEFVAKAGSTRLQPLAAADGLADIGADVDRLAPGDPVGFHSFTSFY